MRAVLLRFLVTFAPILAIALGGLWLARHCDGVLCAVGWIIVVIFGLVAALQAYALISGLFGIRRFVGETERRLAAIEEQDAALLAQGMSFDEVMARRKQGRTDK